MSDQVMRPGKAVLGYFPNPETMLEGMKKVRAANYEVFDAFSPFPIHGMDDAQGLTRSKLPWVTFIGGVTGACIGFGLQYYTSHDIYLGNFLGGQGWAHNIGGKPFNSWPAFIPVLFEFTILFAGISTLLGMLALNRLPNLTKRALDPELTNDRFAIVIEEPVFDEEDEDEVKKHTRFKKFDSSEAEQLLRSAGAVDVKKCVNEGWF
jgi:hypothetical protein